MSHEFTQYYKSLKMSMNCISGEHFDYLCDEQTELWYNMTTEEHDIIREMIRCFRFIQKSRNYIQNKMLRHCMDDIVPPINRDQIFPW